MPVASVPDTTLPMEIWYTQKLKRPKATKKKILVNIQYSNPQADKILTLQDLHKGSV